MYLEQSLMVIGVSILGLMGTMHLIYTFFSRKFQARDPAVTAAMQSSSPVISGQTTVWRAWIGFNASHSLGPMALAAIYIPLSLQHWTVVISSLWLSIVPLLYSLSFLLLAKRYWFRQPFFGILLASACLCASVVLIGV